MAPAKTRRPPPPAGRGTISRDAVLHAGRQLLAEEGLERVSLRNLAARLGVTAPALYAYVEDKDDLLRGIAELEFLELIARFEAIDARDPLDRIRQLCRVYVAYAREWPERFNLIFRFSPELGAGSPTGAELPVATKAFEAAAAATEAAIAAGRIDATDPLLASLTLWTAAHGLANVLLLGFDFGPELEESLIDSVVEGALRGLGATPPAKRKGTRR